MSQLLQDIPNIVVSCTKGKVLRGEHPSFSKMVSGDVSEVSQQWWASVETCRTKLPARALYKGPAWNDIERVIAVTGLEKVFVASAGFGLISCENVVCPYDASFVKGPDYVGAVIDSGEADAKTLWWDMLPKADLSAPIIVAVGYQYCKAMQNTLKEWAARGPEGLLLISLSKGKLPSELEQCRLPVGLSGLPMENRSTGATNALLRTIVEEIVPRVGWGFSDIRNEVISRWPEAVVSPREKLPKQHKAPRGLGGERRKAFTDEDIRSWIVLSDPSGTTPKMKLLREFRDTSGMKCGMDRFFSLIDSVRGVDSSQLVLAL